MTPRFFNVSLWILVFVVYATLSIDVTFAQQKFHCDGDVFLSSVNGMDKNTTLFYLGKYTDNWSLNKFPTKNPVQFNAIGFSSKDSLIYGIEPTKHQLFSIDATGKAFFIDYIPLLGNYYAGDVTPDSKELVLFRSDSLAFINLENHKVRYIKTNSLSGSKVFCTDIAFDYKTGLLYGYDAVSTKLVVIDTQTGQIDNTTYQSIGYYSSIPALFFDKKGNLYGIGTDFSTQTSFIYNFNLKTGAVTSKPFDFFIGERDACSCPPGIRLKVASDKSNYLPCAEIQFTYEISNYSNTIHENVSFVEKYPEGFAIVGIENDFGGTLVTSINSNELSIENLSIAKGSNTLTVTVSVPKDARGDYKINPILIKSDSSTIEPIVQNANSNSNGLSFKIEDIEADLSRFYNDTLEICDEPITIELPFFKDLKYEWNTGDTISSLEVVSSGHYEVSLTTHCETTVKTFDVVDSDLEISLEHDIALNAGQSLELTPMINSKSPITNLVWSSIPIDPKICGNCPSIQIMPKVDTKYTLMVQNAGLCMKYFSVNVRINRKIFVPNAFTPNFDGINDVFFISTAGESIKIKHLYVYDRWGGIVFENKNGSTNSISDGWDGTFNGDLISEGIYVWMVELETPDGFAIFDQGTISLLR